MKDHTQDQNLHQTIYR